MSTELAQPDWQLPPLTPDELGPFGHFPRLTNEEKAAVWQAQKNGRPTRVPVTIATNNRVFLLDPRFRAAGLDYREVFRDPAAMLLAQLRWRHICHQRFHVFCDHDTGLPDAWDIPIDFHNICEAATLGASLEYPPGEIPVTRPILTDDNKRAIFDVDIDDPLATGFLHHATTLSERAGNLAQHHTFLNRPIRVQPYVPVGSDGPLTVAMNLRGPGILIDLRRDPDYARDLFAFIVEAGLRRRAAALRHFDQPEPDEIWLADDSVAMLSPADYRRHVLPHHRSWYDAIDPDRTRTRCMHLCGDATRHFVTMCAELGIQTFDTGFPVDFATLRRQLGPDVRILGGVEITLLKDGSPQAVHARAREILTSGVTTGGQFVLRDANNLPPDVPWSNLAAMYQAAFDFGTLK
jgi:uroporphyrinogen-III decarboxylase